MIICLVTLHDFVESFEEERPKIIHWAVVSDMVEDMRNPVVVWLDKRRVYL